MELDTVCKSLTTLHHHPWIHSIYRFGILSLITSPFSGLTHVSTNSNITPWHNCFHPHQFLLSYRVSTSSSNNESNSFMSVETMNNNYITNVKNSSSLLLWYEIKLALWQLWQLSTYYEETRVRSKLNFHIWRSRTVVFHTNLMKLYSDDRISMFQLFKWFDRICSL